MQAVGQAPTTRRLLTVAHAAEALDCSVRTVHRLRLSGRLRGVRLSAGGVWRIDAASIDALLGSPEVRDPTDDPEAVAREAQAALAAMRPKGHRAGREV